MCLIWEREEKSASLASSPGKKTDRRPRNWKNVWRYQKMVSQIYALPANREQLVKEIHFAFRSSMHSSFYWSWQRVVFVVFLPAIFWNNFRRARTQHFHTFETQNVKIDWTTFRMLAFKTSRLFPNLRRYSKKYEKNIRNQLTSVTNHEFESCASKIKENVLKNVVYIMTFFIKSVSFLRKMKILFKKSAWFPTRFDFDIQCEAVWATQNITIWINCPFEHKVTEFFIADWRVWTRSGRVGPTMWNVALALRKRFRKLQYQKLLRFKKLQREILIKRQTIELKSTFWMSTGTK